jgi:hypothetical protein
VVLAAGMGTLFWGYKKRETLRLAAELERARAVGAEGFDKLETCVAAHELSQRDAFACRDDATRLSAAHDAAMVTMREQQKRSEGVLAATAGKLDACEDERRVALDRHSREQRELTEQKTACETESARVSSARAACENTLATALDAQGECRGELVSCITARQQCSVEEPPNGTRYKEQGTRDREPPSG